MNVDRIIKAVLQREKIRVKGDVNVIFVDNKTIRRLNKQFLGETGLTDVIAFPYETDEVFGDIYISIPVARQNAKRFKEPYERELTRLVVHGLLHLLGYDDHLPNDYKRMWARQESLVAILTSKKRT